MKKVVKRMLSALCILQICLSLFSVSAFAETRFIENDHWLETSDQTVTQLYQRKEPFVVMFFRYSCFNSNLRKVMLEEWMDRYNLDVYGVDVDSYQMPYWVWANLNSSQVLLPVICVSENGTVDCYTANDSMRSIHKRLQEYLGIYDDSEVSFYGLNQRVYQSYSKKNPDQYLAKDIPQAIQLEAERIVSGISDEEQKLRAIYDWVTENIYYNYGMLDGTAARRTSALETYQSKNSVCSGYANLTAALCGAVGIPCRVVSGFATGVGADDSVPVVWSLYRQYLSDNDLRAFSQKVSVHENHAWNEAFVNGKWVILDTTWGSNNDYYPDQRGMIKGTPTSAYYDPDLETFSESHLFWNMESGGQTETSRLPGDVNDDGKVNLKDVGVLQRHVAGWMVVLNLSASDVNGDGMVNMKDIGLLQRYIAGWSVTLK